MGKNQTKISVNKVLRREGYKNLIELVAVEVRGKNTVPVCCSLCSRVEPKALCEHGNPPVTVELGLNGVEIPVEFRTTDRELLSLIEPNQSEKLFLLRAGIV